MMVSNINQEPQKAVKGKIMKNTICCEELLFLLDDTEIPRELVIAICLLFHGIQLDDICWLQINDAYDSDFEVRSQIRKLKFAIPAQLNSVLEEYSLYLDENYDCSEGSLLLPNYTSPIKLAERIEDYIAAPEDILALGRQCYTEHLNNFIMPLDVEIWCKEEQIPALSL